MVGAILGLGVVSFVLSWVGTMGMKHLAPRIGFVDKPGHRKIHSNPKPLGGGVAIFWAVALPLLCVLIILNSITIATRSSIQAAYFSGAVHQTPLALCLLATMLVLHVLGLVDDRQ